MTFRVATARRDLEALSTAGIPVYPQAGRGGGWSLLGGGPHRPVRPEPPEARALFLLLGPAASAAPEARSARRKLTRALPEMFRAEADAAVVDPAGWGARDPERPPLVSCCRPRWCAGAEVRLAYAGRTREQTVRLVDPWGLVDKDETWYLAAGTDAGQRTFRIDRVVDAEITDLVAQRPDDFAPARAWEQVVDTVERRRSQLTATLLVQDRFVRVLRTHFGRHTATPIRPDPTAGPGCGSPPPPRSTSRGRWPAGAR